MTLLKVFASYSLILNFEYFNLVSIIFKYNYYHTTGGYRSIVGLKRVNSNLKVMISVAGRLSKMTSSASSRRNFILSTVKFMAENGFDGLDLHWEYPGMYK